MIEASILPLHIQEHYADRQGYVYLVHAQGTNLYKIGRSVNPVTRLQRLKFQSPYPLKIAQCFWTPNALSDEKKMHTHFRRFRVHGEWFGFDDLKRDEEFSKLRFTALEIAERANTIVLDKILDHTQSTYGVLISDKNFESKILKCIQSALFGCQEIGEIVTVCLHLEKLLVWNMGEACKLFTNTPTEQEIKIAVMSALHVLVTLAGGIIEC